MDLLVDERTIAGALANLWRSALHGRIILGQTEPCAKQRGALKIDEGAIAFASLAETYLGTTLSMRNLAHRGIIAIHQLAYVTLCCLSG